MSIDTIIARLKQHKFFSEFFSDSSFKQLQKYLIVGFTTFALEYALFYLCYKIILVAYYKWGYEIASNAASNIIGMDLKLDTFRYILGNTIAYVITFWFNFLVNRFWSFQSKGNLKRQLKLYGMLFAFNLVAVTLLLYLFSDIIGITPLISKVFVMGAVVSWNFVLYKKVIYK